MATERLFLVPINLNKNEMRLMVIQVLAAAPGTPVEGQVYYDSTLKRLQWYSGTAWIDPTARANHTGTQLAATISDFDTQVRTSRLDQMAAPDADVSLNGHKATNLAAPTNPNDAARLVDVQAAANGLSWKEAVRVATTAAQTLATDFANGSTIDGVVLATGDRILIKNQATASENGIYTVNAAGAPTRAADADTAAEILQSTVFVEEGTTNADTAWVLTTNAPIVLGTTGLTFVQFGAGSAVTAGSGLTMTGNTLNVGAGTGIIANADDVAIDTALVVRKYAANVGDGAATSYTINHALGTRDVSVSVYDNSSPYEEVYPTVEHTDANNVTLRFATAPSANQYRVVVHA